MTRTTRASNKHLQQEVEEGAANNQSHNYVNIGDVIWVKLNGSSWWPAQVVDGSTVSRRCKPSKRANGEVLVRLYGSYKYLYTDSVRSCLEFITMLEKNNGSYIAIIMETLEKDIVRIKSGGSKRRETRNKEKTDEDRTKKRKQAAMQQKLEQHGPNAAELSPKTQQTTKAHEKQHILKSKPNSKLTSTESPQEPSARKMKVMQSLALIAPSESPFRPKHVHVARAG